MARKKLSVMKYVSRGCSGCPERQHYVPPEQQMHESCASRDPCTAEGCTYRAEHPPLCRWCRDKIEREEQARAKETRERLSDFATFKAHVDRLIADGKVDVATQFVCRVCGNVRSKTDDVMLIIRAQKDPRFKSIYESPICDGW